MCPLKDKNNQVVTKAFEMFFTQVDVLPDFMQTIDKNKSHSNLECLNPPPPKMNVLRLKACK